jgi:hypothetical protein
VPIRLLCVDEVRVLNCLPLSNTIFIVSSSPTPSSPGRGKCPEIFHHLRFSMLLRISSTLVAVISMILHVCKCASYLQRINRNDYNNIDYFAVKFDEG